MTKKSDEKSDVKAVYVESVATGQSVGLGKVDAYGARTLELEAAIKKLEQANRDLAYELLQAKANAAQPLPPAPKELIRAVAEAIHKHHPISGGCADGTCARAVIAALNAK